ICQNFIKKECWRLFCNPLHVDCIGEALQTVQSHLDAKNYYAFNPSFDNRTPVTPNYPKL
ncbi:hypothetical protein D3Z48_17125, partial [Clostridiaceae bacterium]|nr:hypothetical protein [Clostridiaceae bacterium]